MLCNSYYIIELDSLIFCICMEIYVWVCDARDSYCIWIENTKRSTFEFIYIMIIDSRECDIKNMKSMPVVTEIV